MCNARFWKGKRVFVTGHTGFKGSWLTLWLASLGAKVIGYSLDVPTIPSLYTVAYVSQDCTSVRGNISDYDELLQCLDTYQPEIVFHMAAQSLVRKSYCDPVETYHTNVMGTVHILEAIRRSKSVQVMINVTSDKCYENTEGLLRPFNEEDRMGGHDPYSASKGCSELVTKSYRRSYFQESPQKVASVRAGNVIGGGDWAQDRLLPDIMRSILGGTPVSIRNPYSLRPWQHVLEPLSGYVCLAERLWENVDYDESWNFGPVEEKFITVEDIVVLITELWGRDLRIHYDCEDQLHEAKCLRLDSSKAIQQLGWSPKLSTRESVEWTVEWYKKYADGVKMRDFTLKQIEKHQELEGEG